MFFQNLRTKILNQQKASREYTKPPGAILVNVSEIYVKREDNTPELTKEPDKVHDHIFNLYSKLFAHQNENFLKNKQKP